MRGAGTDRPRLGAGRLVVRPRYGTGEQERPAGLLVFPLSRGQTENRPRSMSRRRGCCWNCGPHNTVHHWLYQCGTVDRIYVLCATWLEGGTTVSLVVSQCGLHTDTSRHTTESPPAGVQYNVMATQTPTLIFFGI